MSEKHPFDATREKAAALIEQVEEALELVKEIREKGVLHGPFSGGAVPQFGNRTLEEWLIRLKADLAAVQGARVRSRKQKDLFQALFRGLVQVLEQHFSQILEQLRQILRMLAGNPAQANQLAGNFVNHMQAQINQVNAAMAQIEVGLSHVAMAQAKPEPFLEAAERLQEIETQAEAIVKKLQELEVAAKEKVEVIDQHLPRAEELAKEIRALSVQLARDLATDVDAETMPLEEAIHLLGERLTALRKILEERSKHAEVLEKELEELRTEAEHLEEQAARLLERSEEVLGHAEGTGLAKWFKQAHDEYEERLARLRGQFHWVAIGIGIGIVVYVVGMPFALAGLEHLLKTLGWDGNLFITLFSRLMLAAPLTIALFYFWRVYNEYATAERLAHRYRHLQALGASLGGFRMLTGEDALSDQLTAATFLAAVEDPVKNRPPGNEELNFLQRLLGVRFKRKTAKGEEEIEAGVLPKKGE